MPLFLLTFEREFDILKKLLLATKLLLAAKKI
jgi:hypothetical protein